MDDRNKLIEKLGELSAKAYMLGRMYHIDEVTELTKEINGLIAKVFDYSPWHTGTPTEEGWYLCSTKASDFSVHYYDGNEWDFCPLDFVIKWKKIEED